MKVNNPTGGKIILSTEIKEKMGHGKVYLRLSLGKPELT
jgi:hypothetical protein